MTADPALAAIRLPAAARLQVDVDAADYVLTEWAHRARPAVAWWWGVRRGLRGAEARCYVCGAVMATWQSSYPMTETARRAVLDHRAGHLPRAV